MMKVRALDTYPAKKLTKSDRVLLKLLGYDVLPSDIYLVVDKPKNFILYSEAFFVNYWEMLEE